MDLLKAIGRIRSLFTNSTSLYHIYGHQDKNISFHILSREAHLNVQVDHTAQQILQQAHEHQRFVKQPIFPFEGHHL